MSDIPEKPQDQEDQPAPLEAQTSRAEIAGRFLFMLAGGLLLATLVSCACGPTR